MSFNQDGRFIDTEDWQRRVVETLLSLGCPPPIKTVLIGAGAFNAVYGAAWKEPPWSGLDAHLLVIRFKFGDFRNQQDYDDGDQISRFRARCSKNHRNEISVTAHLGALNQGAKCYHFDAKFDNPLGCPYAIMESLPGSSANGLSPLLTPRLKRKAVIAVEDCFQDLHRIPFDAIGAFQATDAMPEAGWLPAQDSNKTKNLHTIVPFHTSFYNPTDPPTHPPYKLTDPSTQSLLLSVQTQSMINEWEKRFEGRTPPLWHTTILKGLRKIQMEFEMIESFEIAIGDKVNLKLFHGDMAPRNVILDVDYGHGEVKAKIIDCETLSVRPAYAAYLDPITACIRRKDQFSDLDFNLDTSSYERTSFEARYKHCLTGTSCQLYEPKLKGYSKIRDYDPTEVLISTMINDFLHTLQRPMFHQMENDICYKFFAAWEHYLPIVKQYLLAKLSANIFSKNHLATINQIISESKATSRKAKAVYRGTSV